MDELYNVFVAIVGKPNVGKSSLINELMGEKIAIVSEDVYKRQIPFYLYWFPGSKYF